VSGPGAADVVAQLRPPIEVGGDGNDRFVVRAPDWTTLGLGLNSTERPSGSRVRIEVDPARL
jgi:primosomal protein N' (replication factor Y)